MKQWIKKNKKAVSIVLFFLLLIILFSYTLIAFHSYRIVQKYRDKIYPNVYVAKYNISNINKGEVEQKIAEIKDQIQQNSVVLVIGKKEIETTFGELGITISEEDLIERILSYDNNMSFLDRLSYLIEHNTVIFPYELLLDEDKTKDFFTNLKKEVDCNVIEGKLVMNDQRQLSYQEGVPAFSLDIAKNVAWVKENLKKIENEQKISLLGDSKQPADDILSSIDTKVSTFSTKFNHKVSRGTNISQAAKNLDGTILLPGQIFSFYKEVGPYHKQGFVYYDGVMGNGVCQVASTIYNVQLLAGLKTIERYSHESKMVYVEGGLDATVAASFSKNKLDFRFQNTYAYPIYISAYTSSGTLTIEFWSNKNAKEGKSYKTQSVQIGARGYQTYLLTYKDGELLNKQFLATTWYPK